MSDEKIDKIGGKLDELVNVTGNLVQAVQLLTRQQQKFEERQQSFEIKLQTVETKLQTFEKSLQTFEIKLQTFEGTLQTVVNKVEQFGEQLKINNGRVEDIARIVIGIDKKLTESNRETVIEIAAVRKENFVTSRKLEWATTTALDADNRVEMLESRVTKIEEKLAA